MFVRLHYLLIMNKVNSNQNIRNVRLNTSSNVNGKNFFPKKKKNVFQIKNKNKG